MNSVAKRELPSLAKAFRAYQKSIDAPEWADYDCGETSSFVGLFIPMTKRLVDAYIEAYDQLGSDKWSAIVDGVLRRIKVAASEIPPLPTMVHTYPWRPNELFGRQEFLEAMRVMIRDHFPAVAPGPTEGQLLYPIPNDPIVKASESHPGKPAPRLSKREMAAHNIVGGENFCQLTNAEILREFKKQLRQECNLRPGTDASKSCLDRIRKAKGYPLSKQISKKRSNS